MNGKEKSQVIIDEDCDLVYSSFYIQGLSQLYGKQNIRFGRIDDKPSGTWGFCFLVRAKNGEYRKIIISLSDSYLVDSGFYNWCDVYGSVNANYLKTPKRFCEKLVPLCPSFGIHCWNLIETLVHASIHFRHSTLPLKKYLGKHRRMLLRPQYEDYLASEKNVVKPDYIFFLSTLWYNDEWNKNDEGVNRRRSNFIRACRELDDVRFEGGLVSQGKDRSSESLFEDCLSDRISMREWMEKTKRSALVFNTPAFWDCHGWKLGEYLAMGKCIVSTELSNDLPAPLEHGVNIHFVEDDKEAMKEAITFIVNHPDYRKKLEKGAREYWERYGTPVASLKLLGIEQ